MSIKIHHGPPGSYKTAGAVKDDLIPAIKSGRPIVTNSRGVTLEGIFEAIPDAPESLELIFVDQTTQEGRDKLARWFHWAPVGAFMLFDEAQSIFPKMWRDADIKALDYPGGFDQAKADNRPANWNDAWDMHRHFNWDVVLTTPRITKIRDDIRGAAEAAYKHKNLGLYGFLFKGSYIEAMHMADDNGTSSSAFQTITKKRIKKNDITWQLYKSTSTGVHQDTKAGFNLFASPRILLPVGILVLAIGWVIHTGLPTVKTGSDLEALASASNPATVQNVQVDSPAGVAPAVYHDPNSSNAGKAGEISPDLMHPYFGRTIIYQGKITMKGQTLHLFLVKGENGDHQETSLGLIDHGYQITVNEHSECSIDLTYQKVSFTVTCTMQFPERQAKPMFVESPNSQQAAGA